MNRLLTKEEFTRVVGKGLQREFPGKWVTWRALGVYPDGRPVTLTIFEDDGEPYITLQVTDNSNGEKQ
jgi:hypothetical protein